MSRVLPQMGLALFLLAVLVFSTGLLHTILEYVSPELAARVAEMGPHPEQRPVTLTEQDQAVELARQGKYDEALAILTPLYAKNQNSQPLARDYAAVLAWAGHDEEAVTVYQTLQPPIPVYVIGPIAHAYRDLGQYDKALATYRLGRQHAPTNVAFAEGEIRSLIDLNDAEGALAVANKDISDSGERPEIVSAKADALTMQAKHDRDAAASLARNQQYPEALSLLTSLRQRDPANLDYTRDYLAVLDWQGGHDAEVTDLYKTLPAADEPDYVMAATAHAYRNQKQYDLANVIFAQGAERFPTNVAFAEGVVLTLGDMKKYDEAIAFADKDIAANGERPEIVNALQQMEMWKPKPVPVKASKAKAAKPAKKK